MHEKYDRCVTKYNVNVSKAGFDFTMGEMNIMLMVILFQAVAIAKQHIFI